MNSRANKNKNNGTKNYLPVSLMKYNRQGLIFETFDPKENIYYFFFSERNQPNLDAINSNDLGHFGLYDAIDIQRFKYYPGTTNIFTFVGFSNPRHREEAKLGKGINKTAFKNVFYNYPYTMKKEELFKPDENLFYVYFKESVPSIKQYHLENIKEYYEFKDIKDMQKGYKIKKK